MQATHYGLSHELLVVSMLFSVLTSFTLSLEELGNGVRCMERDKVALLQLKRGFTNSYAMLSNWGNGEHQNECCNWTGIQCNDKTNHVVLIHLSSSNFGGIISSSLTQLHHLNYLDLSYNDFNGTQIPQFIGSLTHLRYLDLSHSNFGGTIPHELGNLSRLHYLDLSTFSTNLKSNLEWLSNLLSLKSLQLDGLDLATSNTWPQLVNSLPQLQELSLYNSSLPSVESFVHPVSNSSYFLTHLDLSYNNLSGPIPLAFGDLNSLEEVHLVGNHFKGRLPNSMWDFCSLKILSLSGNDLDGGLDEFLLKTTNMSRCLHKSLQSLDLSYNYFTGSVPDLSLFVELKYLSLSGNKLNGTLNDGIGKLSNLVFFDISLNSLQGVITEAHFSKLSKMIFLYMDNNLLSFNISKSWVPPFQLVELSLSYCKVGPQFPKWLKNQKSIQTLNMSHSNIVDIPAWFWRVNSANLTDLDLSFNQIQGEIANLQPQNSTFVFIDLSSNQLKGEIPAFSFVLQYLNLSSNMFSGSIFSLCSMTLPFLHFLDLSHNQLSERLLVDCWLNFEHLVIVDLSFNNFSGNVPTSLLSLPHLYALRLQNNKFQSISSFFSSNLTDLQSLDLSDNEISNFLPSWIGHKFPKLNVLSLKNNKFFGSLPSEICNLTQILVFDLSVNHLSGSIPKCFDQFIALAKFTSNVTETNTYPRIFDGKYFLESISISWKGVLEEYKSTLRFQRMLDLSDNQLIGEISIEIMDLVELVSLNLSWNKLSGEINQEIGRLNQLQSLDLSRNLLHGHIPSSLSQLNFLSELNLSFNNLSGKIPTGLQLQTLNDASSYYGNPELCGAPLDRICPDGGKDNGRLDVVNHENDDEDLLEMYGFYIFVGFGLIVGFCASCGSLIFCKSWRYAFFNFCSRICDNIYVKIAISVNKLRRKVQQ